MKLNFYIFAVICVLFLAHNYYLDQKGVEFELWIFQARIIVLGVLLGVLWASGFRILIAFFDEHFAKRKIAIDTTLEEKEWKIR